MKLKHRSGLGKKRMENIEIIHNEISKAGSITHAFHHVNAFNFLFRHMCDLRHVLIEVS